MLISISDTPNNERGPRHTRSILAAIHHASSRHDPVSLIFARHADVVGLFCRVPDEFGGLVRRQFHAKYPDSSVEALPEEALALPTEHQAWTLRLQLRPDIFPIVRYQQFHEATGEELDDPVGGILQSLSDKPSGVQASIEITVIPAPRRRINRAQSAIAKLTRPFFRSHRFIARRYALLASSTRPADRLLAWCLAKLFARRTEERLLDDELSKTASRMHDSEKELQAASHKLGQHLFEVELTLTASAPPDRATQAQKKLVEMAAVLNKFTAPRFATFRVSQIEQNLNLSKRNQRFSFLLSDEEIATIWHPPTKGVRDTSVQATHSRRFEPPAELPLNKREGAADDVCELGRLSFQDRNDRFGIRTEDRFRHLFVCGKTGNGKSTVLYNAIVSDIQQDRGVAVVDPHGDLAESVLASVPSFRTNDVILIDPADLAFPVSINPLDVDRSMANLACDGMVSTFRKVFGTGSHTPRLEDILWNTVLALMLAGDSTLLDILRMFGPDERFRQQIVSRVSNPVVRNWWQTTFPKLQSIRGEDPFASVENKLRQLLTNPVIRNIVAQPRTRVDFREAMDSGKIVIVNLSKGKLGERTSSFLGSLVVTQMQLAAMSRADVSETVRRPFYFYVDEFHNVATSSFASILSEARKFKLGLCLATQFLDQVDEATLEAVFGNVGSMLVFAVGPNDADVLAEQLGGRVTASDLVALPKYRAYVRLMIDGESPPAFSMQTIEPAAAGSPERGMIVREQSRRRYAKKVDTVERHVASTLAST